MTPQLQEIEVKPKQPWKPTQREINVNIAVFISEYAGAYWITFDEENSVPSGFSSRPRRDGLGAHGEHCENIRRHGEYSIE
jgi:hypothetical protein